MIVALASRSKLALVVDNKVVSLNRSGFALWLKRLEEAKFAWPKDIHKKVVDISAKDLELLLDGVNIWTRFESVYFEVVT